MKIRLASLHEGINNIEEEVFPVEFEFDENVFSRQFKLTGTVDKSSRMLDVLLHVDSEALLTCDRCLADFEFPIVVEFRVQVLFDFEESKDKEDIDGLIFISKKDTEIDLSQEIIDAVYLAIPIKILCKEDCKGLCYRCGTDLNEETCECDKVS